MFFCNTITVEVQNEENFFGNFLIITTLSSLSILLMSQRPNVVLILLSLVIILSLMSIVYINKNNFQK